MSVKNPRFREGIPMSRFLDFCNSAPETAETVAGAPAEASPLQDGEQRRLKIAAGGGARCGRAAVFPQLEQRRLFRHGCRRELLAAQPQRWGLPSISMKRRAWALMAASRQNGASNINPR